MNKTEEILAVLPGQVYRGLQQADQRWQALKAGQISVPQAYRTDSATIGEPQFDVAIAGGTLGIFLGAALAAQGWRVAVLERGELRGRDQEWNTSRAELSAFETLGLLSPEQIEQAIATEYNPARVAFHQGVELWVKDVLNIGVDPVYLLAALKERFLAAGGKLLEQTPLESVSVHPDGVQIHGLEESLTARLLVDAMGHFSPLARQARGGQRPDAVCLVVGTCATGYLHNDTGDLLASFTPIRNQCQYFWEAFPARDGRTTYLFTYLDAHPQRPNIEDLFEDYFALLPEYQGISLEQLNVKRALFGLFPCYRDSPLQFPVDRLLAVGDSSGNQSPLSFGGFGAMLRHLGRLTVGVSEALEANALDQKSLALLQPYQPSLSVTWLFQQTMSVGVDEAASPNQINGLLSDVFTEMYRLGDPVLKPFLQDVVQFPALTRTLAQTSLRHPDMPLRVLPQVGLPALLRWLGHYGGLGAYAGLDAIADAVVPLLKTQSPQQRYRVNRWREAWRYGAGKDYGH
ncbi:MAG: FAD-dependent oxidoreductase [Cyanobacteria bacterium P01_A01_bin.135]